MSRIIIIILINIHIRKENANKTEDLKQRNQMNSYLLIVILVTYFLTSTALLVPASARIIASANGPTVNDTHLKVELVASGLKGPTAMAFVAPNDILVTEKNTGNIQRIVNGVSLNCRRYM